MKNLCFLLLIVILIFSCVSQQPAEIKQVSYEKDGIWRIVVLPLSPTEETSGKDANAASKVLVKQLALNNAFSVLSITKNTMTSADYNNELRDTLFQSLSLDLIMTGDISIYKKTETPFKISIVIYDAQTGKPLWSSTSTSSVLLLEMNIKSVVTHLDKNRDKIAAIYKKNRENKVIQEKTEPVEVITKTEKKRPFKEIADLSRKVPDIQFIDFRTGKPHTFDDFKGKIIIISMLHYYNDFSWEYGLLERLQKIYPGDLVSIFGCVDMDEKTIEEIAKVYNMQIPVIDATPLISLWPKVNSWLKTDDSFHIITGKGFLADSFT